MAQPLQRHTREEEEVLSAVVLEEELTRRQADRLAQLMDSAIRLPGTSIRVGLDPVLGLLPGIGDAVAGVIGTWILLLAVRLGVPRIVQIRMGINMLLNAVIGVVPGLGDLFSFWFKSNARNAALLRRYTAPSVQRPRHSTLGDWLVVLGVLLAAGAGIGGVLWLLTA